MTRESKCRNKNGLPPSELIDKIPLGEYDPTNPGQRAALANALLELGYCRETMAILQNRLGVPLLTALLGQDIQGKED